MICRLAVGEDPIGDLQVHTCHRVADQADRYGKSRLGRSDLLSDVECFGVMIGYGSCADCPVSVITAGVCTLAVAGQQRQVPVPRRGEAAAEYAASSGDGDFGPGPWPVSTG